jgi:predicted TIM-barrel fold metal-dependent hydrolase
MPERPSVIIDSHLHVWQADVDYPDPAVTTVSPVCHVPVELLIGYMDELQIERAVIVQPMFPREDNRYIVECCQQLPDRLAAVCVVDPNVSGADRRLRSWHARGCRGLRLRPRVATEERCFGDSSTYPLWTAASELGMVVSLLANTEHVATIVALADRFPDATLVVDHLAHPNMSRTDRQPLMDLAACPNVIMKISGFPYFAVDPYPYGDCRPLVEEIYAEFGPHRMMWGSDFPHILLQSGYLRSLRLLPRLLPDINAGELATIRYHNAKRLYWD